MTGVVEGQIDAAFAELGLATDAPAADLRRAYLRVIKTRRPETDPEGFRRARESFDLLTAWFEAGQPASIETLADHTGWDALPRLLEEGKTNEARAMIRALLDANDAPKDLFALLDTLLSLHARSPGALARKTLRSFVAFVDRLQLELRFSSDLARWLFVRELSQFPDGSPAEIERAISEWLLHRGPDANLRLNERLRAFARRSTQTVADFRAPFKRAAPRLSEMLRPLISGGTPSDNQDPFVRQFIKALVGLFGALVVLFIALQIFLVLSAPKPHPVKEPIHLQTTVPPPPARTHEMPPRAVPTTD